MFKYEILACIYEMWILTPVQLTQQADKSISQPVNWNANLQAVCERCVYLAEQSIWVCSL